MRIFRHPRALIVVLLLPLLVAGVGMWALKDRVDRLDTVPAAVVNLDEGTHMTIDGKDQFVPFGRQLAGALTQPSTTSAGKDVKALPTTGFDWTLTDQEDAQQGLRDGTYAAVIVIPKDFSRKLGTLGTPDAVQADIQVTTNDASGALDSAIGIAVSQAAASGTGSELTRQYLSQLYVGFNTVQDSFSQAADGAEGVHEGVSGLSDGMGQTRDGARQLSDGASGLAGGTRDLASGTDGLAQGSRALSDGIGQLSGGADQLAQGTGALSSGLGQLSTGADGLARGAEQLSAGVNGTPQTPGLVQGIDQLNAGIAGDGTAKNPGLVAGSQQLATGARQNADGVAVTFHGADGKSGLVAGVEQYTGGVEKISSGMSQACGTFADAEIAADPRIAALCSTKPVGGNPSVRVGLETLVREDQGRLAAGIALAADGDGTSKNPGLVAGSEQLAVGAEAFAQQAPALAQGVQQLSDGVHRLGGGASQLATGSRQLAGGVSQSAEGAAKLADGSTQLADGVGATADGADKLADGTEQLATGAGQLADGADQLASGTDQLADGTDQLADGSEQLDDGAGKLASGLREGANQMPMYTEDERTAMSDMAAQPVSSVATRQNEADGAATATFPFVVALALWLGAFGAFLLLPALSRRFLDAAMPMWQVVLRSLLPALAIGVVQTVAVLTVIAAIGVQPVSALAVGAISLAGAVAFAALHQALLTLLGNRVGRIASLVVMILQVVVLAGILPLQTAPPLLQSISAFMPITILSKGLTHAALGGALVSTSATLLALIAWALGSIAVTLLASRSARSFGTGALVTGDDALPA